MSRKTVFTSVGGKVGLLKLAIDWALVGDDEPVALDARPVVRELEQETDPGAVVMWAHMVTGIAARLALLHPVLTAAADVDEQAAALNAVSERNRLGGARGFVEQLHEPGSAPQRPERGARGRDGVSADGSAGLPPPGPR